MMLYDAIQLYSLWIASIKDPSADVNELEKSLSLIGRARKPIEQYDVDAFKN